ncbi:helix-turn-helix transcriptional regulator [Seohaeicola sp. SP36]|uniref:HTH-type transcriptional regulator NimR n=1 Tax=Roseovarius mucosus TaxID=215743 RepID=A0A1V0RUX2_9RHOB|nr:MULTISPECIES: helix-turn-helix transcriptional regulator [Roseobacteraceae]ARE85534.1 HTH-type transcriptional regulator NimR [Roseovarius mucosus]MDD9737940.1 helix-turn-helix transcriptional regulator [Seohaeicola sp. SP36]PKQ11340.1 MAG: AraC family transcriptional regulator [Alphaproteobacteria bacterium HGW-Alphaproteobacteria-1]
MRNIALADVDQVPRPVLAIGTDYRPGALLDFHTHRRAQFLYGMTGLMEVETGDGTWMVPPYSGVWLPAGKCHRVRMNGVSTRSLYIEPEAAPRTFRTCEVLIVTPLLHHLLMASADLPAVYDENGRDGALAELLLHELQRASSLPLFAPMPRDTRLANLCRDFLGKPDIHSLPADWAKRLNCSERTFTRLFRQQTGLSFGVWRKHACLMAALPLLLSGRSVTWTALELGYESPGAFSNMFAKMLGRSPTAFVQAAARQSKESS